MRASLIACLIASFAGPAWAGAWTAEPGTRFASRAVAFDAWGSPRLRDDRYFELGWREGVTVGGSYSRSRRAEGFGARASRPESGRASAFLRQRIWQGPGGEVASVEAAAGTGFGRREDAMDAAARLRLGRGFGTPLGDAFAEADLGWRMEFDEGEDRLLAGAAVGLKPLPGWMAMVEARMDAAPFAPSGASEEIAVTARLVRDFDADVSLSIDLGASVWSRGGPEASHLRLGLWRRF